MATAAVRKADVVVRDLMRRIAHGDLDPGALLPTETELADRYGVNRSVVREAVKQLEVHRLVKPIKRRGTEVLDPLCSPSADVLWAMLEPEPGTIDREALAELLEIRAVLDVEMCAMAAARRTDEDLAALDALLLDLRAAIGDSDRYVGVMDDLALALAKASHNRIYQMLAHWHRRLRGEHDPLQTFVRLANEPHRSGVAFLVELIRERRVEETRSFLQAVHAWMNPRILAAAALASGEPLEDVMEALK
ncbi:MAG: GntR family transcriptional regulator [Polyangiaceae bacterium]